ncbi:hypothetical protein [Paludisphaera mucosa]|uniref:Uncharacterized protein n=1 Tax=Paludisphaera mucosa TaxID=3030827 RepID=A0ABT6FAQ4_9BACT|nr:hypothetical protein [Paludisphaera mucosa]MDG3004468.1 hypothetical protein [Paludisphaera mucosa]
MAKLSDKMQQLTDAAAAVEIKVQQLLMEKASLQDQINNLGAGPGELSADQESTIDVLIERLKSLAA